VSKKLRIISLYRYKTILVSRETTELQSKTSKAINSKSAITTTRNDTCDFETFSIPATVSAVAEVDVELVVSMHDVIMPSTVFNSSTVVVFDSDTVPPTVLTVWTVVSTTL